MTTFKKTVKGVTNKRIVGHICEFIEESVAMFDVDWNTDSQREAFVEVLEDCVQMLVDTKEIEQFKVICDRRNNKIENVRGGFFTLDVYFKARNCLNRTHISYLVDTNYYLEDSDTLDFQF